MRHIINAVITICYCASKGANRDARRARDHLVIDLHFGFIDQDPRRQESRPMLGTPPAIWNEELDSLQKAQARRSGL